jgi:hypothetical protein
LSIDQVIDCSFKGYERQPPALTLGEGTEDGRLTGFTTADSSTSLRPHPRLMSHAGNE